MDVNVRSEGELPEAKFVRQAEQMFAAAKKKALRLGAILGILLVVWLIVVHRKPVEQRPSVMTQVLFAAAILAYGVGRGAVGIRHAKQYLKACQRALVEAEMGQGGKGMATLTSGAEARFSLGPYGTTEVVPFRFVPRGDWW